MARRGNASCVHNTTQNDTTRAAGSPPAAHLCLARLAWPVVSWRVSLLRLDECLPLGAERSWTPLDRYFAFCALTRLGSGACIAHSRDNVAAAGPVGCSHQGPSGAEPHGAVSEQALFVDEFLFCAVFVNELLDIPRFLKDYKWPGCPRSWGNCCFRNPVVFRHADTRLVRLISAFPFDLVKTSINQTIFRQFVKR